MSNLIRVAQVLNRMDSGGIEAVVMNYYRRMNRSKVQFDFYFAEDSLFPQQEELERMGAGIYRIPPYSQVIPYQRALQKAFKEKGYQIVHAHLSTMSIFPLFAAWRAGVPVRICHSHSTANWGEGKKTLLKYILRPFNKIFADRWFACGEMAGRWMYGNRAFDQGLVRVMPNAIDAARYAYDPEARRRLRRELGIGENAFVVGHVGRFTYAKNHPFLIEVFQRLSQRNGGALLLLVGEGEMEAEIRALAEKKGLEGRVIFAGVRQDADKLYSAMDVFCLPSLYEGFPVVALEAQAAGLPCICSQRVSREIGLSRQVVHLSTGEADLPVWVEQLQKAHLEKTRDMPAFAENFSIAHAAESYQAYLEESHESARSKS